MTTNNSLEQTGYAFRSGGLQINLPFARYKTPALPDKPPYEENLRRLTRAAKFKLVSIAKLAGVPWRQFQRQTQRELGCCLREWLGRERIVAAQDLLLSGRLIKDTAFEVGFRKADNFSRAFKRQLHLTPTEFIASHSAPCRPGIGDCRPGIAA